MRIFIFLSFLVLTACSSTGGGFAGLQPLAPEIKLKNFKLLKMGFNKQSYRLKLQIKNPNSFPLPINGLDYQLLINKQLFAEGNSTQAVTIPALGSNTIEIDVKSNLMDVIEGWSQWFSLAKRSLEYKITGNVGVSSFAIPIPFQYADSVDLSLIE